jgi:hypothetical protein
MRKMKKSIERRPMGSRSALKFLVASENTGANALTKQLTLLVSRIKCSQEKKEMGFSVDAAAVGIRLYTVPTVGQPPDSGLADDVAGLPQLPVQSLVYLRLVSNR